jgi:hypothetical protein
MRLVSRSSFAAMPVESARSQNITVTCRRSPTASGASYSYARLSAVKLAGDINARVADDAVARRATGEDQGGVEKLKPILGPSIDLEVAREPQA